MDPFDNNRNLTHQLAHKLGAAIVQGQYAVNESFPTEADLSRQFNISRSVTREAVKMLTAKGLISSRPRQGIRVLPSNRWNMFDADVLNWTLSGKPSLRLLKEFTQLRIAIEPEAAVLAARTSSQENLDTIRHALERLELAATGGDDPLEADIAFHTSILLASDNRFFIQLREFIQAALRVSIACTNQLKGVRTASYGDHKRIFDAIVSGRDEQARVAVQELLGEALKLIEASLDPEDVPA